MLIFIVSVSQLLIFYYLHYISVQDVVRRNDLLYFTNGKMMISRQYVGSVVQHLFCI